MNIIRELYPMNPDVEVLLQDFIGYKNRFEAVL